MKVTLRKCGILLTTLLSVAISFNYSNAQITGASAVCVNGTTTLVAPSTTISGGTITNVSGYNVHTFTSAGTFVIPAGLNINAELLVVAGGGGGGYRHAGGGGAGGLIYNASSTITGSQAVVIGAGGIGGYSDPINGANGGNSSFGSFTAIGGGGGGTNNLPANSGGSGGGGSNGSLGGAGTAGQGNAGGNQGLSCCNPFGAGGGGYSAAGASTLPTVGSVGGAGFTTSMTGSSLSFAGGGGGGSNLTTNYAGGIGGGGLGANALNMTGGNGTPNTGGGGGGGGANGSTSGIGGVGGSGIVIIKYAQAVGTWTSSNTAVATVNASTGAVTGVSAGSATITYSVTVGGVVNNFTKVITCGTPTVAINNSNPSVCVGGSSTLSTQTNLVGYWKFDEGTGTTVADESGNNLNGSFASQGSNPTWASSTAFTGSGNSVQFASGYINVPDNAAINTMQSKFTIEAWIYQTDNSNNTIVDRANYNFLFEANPNGAPGLGFYNPNGGWSYSTTAIPTNQWVHVACTWDGSTNKLIFYKDGLQTDVFNRGSGLYFNAGPINIARQEPNGCQCNNMNGKIDELRLWSVVKTQAEIQSNMNQNVPVSSYGSTYTWAPATGLNTTSGSSVIASPASTTIYTVTATSAAGCTAIANTTVTVNTVTVTATNNGPKTVGSNIGFTANGAVTYAWTGPNGFASTSQNPTIVNAQLQNAGVYTVTGTSNGCTGTATTTVVVNALPASALSFGATADYVNLGSVLPANASYTKEGWIYSTDATSLNNLFSTYADPIYIPSGKINVGQGGNYGVVNDPDLFPMNQWVHVAITYDKPSTTLKLYVNGVLKGSSPNAPAFTGGLTYLGQHPSGGGQSSVKMDEVRFWSRALCQSELLNNMNCEMNPAGQQGLVALYHFNQGLINSTNTITTLTDATGNGHDGTLVGFANSGAVSNWVAGSNISGTCSVFTAVAAPITGTTTVCTGLTSTLANANAGTWTSSNTAVATISSAGIVTGVSAGTSIISFTNDCGGISTITITVNPLPTITGTLVACATRGRQLIGSGTPAVSNPWTSSNTSIATVNNTGFVTAVAAAGGSVVITYTNSNGCSITANFTVPPLPPTPTVSVVNNCNGTSTLTASGYTSYQWAIVGGQVTATGISITVSTPGTYGARSESSQCVSSFAYGIAAPKTTPVANITADGSTSVCIGNTVTLHANTGAGFSYQWLNNGNTIEGATGANYIATTSGSYTVVITNNGCSSDASNAISITIADTTPPQFTSTASILTPNVAGVVQATSAAGAQVQYTIPTAVDNCSTTVIVNAFPASGTIFPIGVTTVTVTAIDGNNNVSQTTFDITVKDTQKPIVKTLDLTVELDASGSATITPYSIENGSTDNTIIQNYSIDKSSFSCADLGANLVTLTVTDAYGNSNTGTAIITVKDFIAPQFTSSALITTPNVMGIVMATGANGAVVNFNLPTATDNCANGLTIVATPASGSVFSIGSTIVRIVATDASGNTSEIGFVMNVRGRVPAIEKPADITVNSPANQCGAAVNFAATETFGIPASVITYTEDGSPISSGANFSVGVHTITATATNAVGYTATTFTITVNDVTPPVFTSTAAILTANNAGVVQATSAAGALVMYTIPTATDNCSGNVNVNAFPASGSVFPIGVTTVTVTATDAYNNVSQTNFTVSVADTQVPTVFTQNLTIQLNASGAATINAMQIENGSTDNTIITNYILDKTNFDCSNVGANTVTLTVIDAYGNSNTGTAIVTVQDNIAPQFISSATITTANVAGVVTATSANGAVVNFTLPSATDNCANGLNVVATPASGSVFAIGTTTVTVVATDASGNRTSTSFVVKVAGVAPVIHVPANSSIDAGATSCSAAATFAATETTGIPSSTITYKENGLLISSGATLSVGVHTITATATNSVSSSTGTFTITVKDVTAPIITAVADATENAGVNCNALVTVPAPTATDNCGVTGNALNFDGSNDYVNIPRSIAGDFSIEFWMKTTQVGPNPSGTQWYQGIGVVDAEVGGVTNDFGIALLGNRIGFGVGNPDRTIFSSSSVNTGNWVHVAATRQQTSGQIKLYINGILQSTGTGGTNLLSVPSRILIGLMQTGANGYYKGSLTGIRLWSTVRTATEISSNMNAAIAAQTGLVANYDCNQGVANGTNTGINTLINKASSSNNGTLNGFALSGSSSNWVDGVASSSVTLTNNFNNSANASGTYPLGVTNVIWTATDAAGNTAIYTQKVTVVDVTAPTINIVANINAIATSAAGAAVNYIAPVGKDNCSAATTVMTAGLASGSTFPIGTTVVTYTVTDAAGLSASTSFNVKVTGLAPVIVTPGDITVNNDPGMNGAVVSYTATETTAIPASTITYSIAPGSFFTVGTHSVTATATNAVGTSHVDFNVIVVDHEKPTIATADNISANNDENACGAIVVTTAPAASDNTSIESVTGVRADGLALTAAYPVGSTVITWTAKDVNGNINSSTQTITVTDNQLPTITAPAAVTVTADAGLCSASQVALGHAVTADNCAVATTTNNAPATFPVGSTTVTWTVTDIHGNVSTATQIVTVTDDELPVIVNTPINITQVNDQGNCSAVVNWTAATATDNCPGVTISSDHQSGETFPVGTTTVTYTATDAHGHTVTSSFTITVNDTEKPTITATDKTQTADAGVCKATVTVAVPITADNCAVQSVSNSINGTNNASGVYPVGTTTITWTVTDIHSNVNTTTQTITVNDDEKPVVATQNITIQLDASGAASITPAQINNGSTDNCGIASVTLDKTSFYCSNVGANTVTLTVTDIHGNVSTATAVVTVQDKVAPIAKAKNITVGLDAVTGSATITGADVNNGSSDACGIASMTVFPSSFTCANQGANTVTLTVTDVNGNVSTTTAVVTVVDDKGPVPAVLTLPVINGQCYATALTLKPGEHEEDHDGEDNDHEGDDDDDHEGIELEHYRLVAPTAMDNCSGLITGTTTDPLTYYNQGTYIIHWKFVDAKGNVTIQLQTVIVKDNIAPTPKYATLPVIKGECSVTIGGNGKGEKGEDKGNDDNDHSNGAWAKDNCSGWIKGTTTSPLTYTVQGTYTITWDYNDGHGNISHQLQTVIVKDVTAPKINAPKDKTIACGSSILPAVTGMATATDNCSTPVISFTDVNNGTQIVRTWKATDAAGNFGTDVQVIKLTPAFSATTKSTPTSTVYTGGNNNNLYLGYGAQSTILSVTGLPAGSYTYTWTGAGLSNSTSATPVFTASAAGVTTLYVTVTNANGCSSTASISICVTDVRVPGSNGTLIYVCHQGSSKSGGTQTLSIPVAQVAAHLNNTCTNGKGGDRLGSCSSNPCNSKTDVSAVDPKTEEQIEVKPLKADVSSVTPVDEIKVTVMPNPSTTYFTLKFESKDLKTPMSLRVMDASGRAIDSKQQIDPSSTIQIGHNYPSGTFYTEVIQGNRRKVVQLIKARG